MRKFIYHERPEALKTSERKVLKEEKRRSGQRAKWPGFLWMTHRFVEPREHR